VTLNAAPKGGPRNKQIDRLLTRYWS